MTLLKRKPAEWSPQLLHNRDETTPEVGWVSIGELHYDQLRWDGTGPHGYQRPVDENRIQQYCEAFDSRLIGLVVVNRRDDGSLWVIDGQHRIEVLRRLGKSVVMAEIHSLRSPQDEADLYYKLNSQRKQPNMWNRFGSRASSGDPKALALIELAAEYGFRIGTADRSIASIAAVNTLETIYSWVDGPRLLRQTLRKIADVWPADVIARDGVFIQGLALVIYGWDGSYVQRDGHSIDWARFDNVFSKVKGIEVTKRCKELKIEAGFAMNGTTYAVAIRDIYNGKANFTKRLEGRVLVPSKRGPRSAQSLSRNRITGR